MDGFRGSHFDFRQFDGWHWVAQFHLRRKPGHGLAASVMAPRIDPFAATL